VLGAQYEVGVEIDVGDGKHALSPERKRQAELAAPGIESPPAAAPGQLDIETHAA